MKIKQYIVTYNNSFQINQCLKSIFDGLSNDELSILDLYIINNHSKFSIDDVYKSKVTVLNNVLRPDRSTGHLSRNWNQALINGFGSLKNADCDIVITNQDDTVFAKNYINTIIQLHKKYDLLQFGAGDNYISYTVDAVKRIGLWDERFCSIGYQEADYLCRAVLYHAGAVSINDPTHRRIHNGITESPIVSTITGLGRKEEYTIAAVQHHDHNRSLFQIKWGFNPDLGFPREMDKYKIPRIESFIMYPYFERDIETLKEQQYYVPGQK